MGDYLGGQRGGFQIKLGGVDPGKNYVLVGRVAGFLFELPGEMIGAQGSAPRQIGQGQRLFQVFRNVAEQLFRDGFAPFGRRRASGEEIGQQTYGVFVHRSFAHLAPVMEQVVDPHQAAAHAAGILRRHHQAVGGRAQRPEIGLCLHAVKMQPVDLPALLGTVYVRLVAVQQENGIFTKGPALAVHLHVPGSLLHENGQITVVAAAVHPVLAAAPVMPHTERIKEEITRCFAGCVEVDIRAGQYAFAVYLHGNRPPFTAIIFYRANPVNSG